MSANNFVNGTPCFPELTDPNSEFVKAWRALDNEADPNGLPMNAPGAKGDAGKVRPALVLGGFARALWEVSKVGTGGAAKYTDNGWMEVANGVTRYDDAKMRHWLKEKMGEKADQDTELLHAAHEAWNALARLDLLIREQEKANGATK